MLQNLSGEGAPRCEGEKSKAVSPSQRKSVESTRTGTLTLLLSKSAQYGHQGELI